MKSRCNKCDYHNYRHPISGEMECLHTPINMSSLPNCPCIDCLLSPICHDHCILLSDTIVEVWLKRHAERNIIEKEKKEK